MFISDTRAVGRFLWTLGLICVPVSMCLTHLAIRPMATNAFCEPDNGWVFTAAFSRDASCAMCPYSEFCIFCRLFAWRNVQLTADVTRGGFSICVLLWRFWILGRIRA